MKIAIALLLLTTLVYGKDDKKPELTQEQKSQLLQAERDYLDAKLTAQPYESAADAAQRVMLQTIQGVIKGVDLSKWTLNPTTLEFDAVPAKPEVKK